MKRFRRGITTLTLQVKGAIEILDVNGIIPDILILMTGQQYQRDLCGA